MMTHEEWQALVEDSRHEPWDFFPRHGGMKVAGRWRFPRAWLWWDERAEHFWLQACEGWRFRIGDALRKTVEPEWPEEGPDAIRLMQDCMVEVAS